MTEMKTSEVLDLAADLLEGHEWVQGAGWEVGVDGGLCLEGGIIAALVASGEEADYGSDLFRQCPAYVAVADYLRDQLLPDDPALWRWNDADGRTKGEVIAVLRAASAAQATKELSVERDAVTA